MLEDFVEKYQCYQDWISKKQNRLYFPDTLLNQAIGRTLGDILFQKQRVIGGEQNVVYEISSQNQELIFRGAKSKYADFELEARISVQCQESGVPVAKVLDVSTGVVFEGELWSSCLLSKLKGQSLIEGIVTNQVTEVQLHHIVNQAGYFLCKIHQIDTSSLGFSGEFDWWNELQQKYQSSKAAYESNLGNYGFDPEIVKSVFCIIMDRQKTIQATIPCLVHGDFTPKHILFDDQEVTGVIDFGNSQIASPAFDFAWWDYFVGKYIPKRWLCESYSNQEIFDESLEDRIMIYRMIFGLDLLGYFGISGYKYGIVQAMENIQAGLAYFGA